VAGAVPIVSVAVPLTPSHTWLLVQANVAPVPAAAPAEKLIVPVPIANLPATKPFAVTFPLPVTVSSAVADEAPPPYTINPPVPDPEVLLIATAFAPTPAFSVVCP